MKKNIYKTKMLLPGFEQGKIRLMRGIFVYVQKRIKNNNMKLRNGSETILRIL